MKLTKEDILNTAHNIALVRQARTQLKPMPEYVYRQRYMDEILDNFNRIEEILFQVYGAETYAAKEEIENELP